MDASPEISNQNLTENSLNFQNMIANQPERDVNYLVGSHPERDNSVEKQVKSNIDKYLKLMIASN